ncbi:asparaginase [Williamsia sp.]|uniref:asparaginase n=1 Tax=Williamsia sp. TaxID=1872085 RepID=UPI002F93CAFB
MTRKLRQSKLTGMVKQQALVSILTTGGTIASRRFADGARPDVGGAELTAAAAADGVQLRVREVLQVDSGALLPADQDAIRLAVASELADPAVSGVVVTHGTDTMEETAMLLDLMYHDPRPVVMTGARLPADSPDADGPANLDAAIALAADPAMRGRGVFIAMGGELIPARGACKSDTSTAMPFRLVHPDLPQRLVPPAPIAHVRVDLVALYPGVDAHIIDWVADAGAAAIVLSASGSGNTHPDVVAAVGRVVDRGLPVVVCSRVAHGEVVPLYGGGGGAIDLIKRGAIISPWLRASQARIAVQAILAGGGGPTDITAFFAPE